MSEAFMQDASTFKVLAQSDGFDFCMMPGDTLTVTYTDDQGVAHELQSVEITNAQRIDTVIALEFTNAFGLASGLCAVVGAKHKPEPLKVGWVKLQADPHLPAMLPCKDVDALSPVNLHY